MIGMLALNPIKGEEHLRVAAEHNKRTMYAHGFNTAEKIDPSRSHLNYSLGGEHDPAAVLARWHRLREEANIFKPKRKDEMSAIEIVFSLPQSAEHVINLRNYFTDCTAFACKRFAAADVSLVLSSDVHLDQEQPHCHVLILPLVDGKMQGATMFYGATKQGGEPRSFRQHHHAFFTEVARAHGLQKATPKLGGATKRAAVRAVVSYLDACASDADRWATIVKSIMQAVERDPEPFTAEIGLASSSKPQKTLRQIALSSGKGPKTKSAAEASDSAFAQRHRSRTERTDSEQAHIGFVDRGERVATTEAQTSVGLEVEEKLPTAPHQLRTLCSDRVCLPTHDYPQTSSDLTVNTWRPAQRPSRHRQSPIPAAVCALLAHRPAGQTLQLGVR